MNFNDTYTNIATQAGVWVLTAAAMLATTEMLHHQEVALAPVQVGDGHTAQMSQEPISARAEGGKESARLPEEYDIGLRMPGIGGI